MTCGDGVLFGSVAQGTARADSDIDILVQMDPDVVEHEREHVAHQQEDAVLHEHRERLPVRALGVAAGGGDCDVAAVTHVEAGEHDGHHTGAVEVLGDDETHERHHQRDGDVEHGVADSSAGPERELADGDSDDHRRHHSPQEVESDVPSAELLGVGRDGDGAGEQHERGGMGDEPLALEDGHHTRRQAQPFAKARRGHRARGGETTPTTASVRGVATPSLEENFDTTPTITTATTTRSVADSTAPTAQRTARTCRADPAAGYLREDVHHEEARR